MPSPYFAPTYWAPTYFASALSGGAGAVALPVQPNNFVSTAGSARAAGAATFTLAAGDGARLAAEVAKIPGAGAISASQPVRFTAVQKGGYLAGQVIDPARAAHFQATGVSGDTLTGVALADGSPDLAFRAGDVVVFDVQAGHLKAIQDALGLGSGGPGSGVTYSPFVASGPAHAAGLVPDPGATAGVSRYLCEDGTFRAPPAAGAVGGPRRFTVPAPSGGDDAPAILATIDAFKAWHAGDPAKRGQLYFACDPAAGGSYRANSGPLIVDASYLEVDGDPGTTLTGSGGAILLNFPRVAAKTGQLSARLRTDLAPLVPDGSVSAGARYAIRAYDPSIEVVGTPPGGATFTLDIAIGNLTATTAAIAANADAATVAAAMQAAVATMAGLSAATVTATGGPLGTAPVSYTFGGAAAGLLGPTLTQHLSGFGTAYLNCGQKCHPSFAASFLGQFDPNDTSAAFRKWADVRVPTVCLAFSADWANVGKAPDGTFQSVGLCGLGNKGQAQPWRAGYSNATPPGVFSLTLDCVAPGADPYSPGTDYTLKAPINNKAQALQWVAWQVDLDAGTALCWGWDGTLSGGRMNLVPLAVTGTPPPAGSTLRENAHIPFQAFGAGSQSTSVSEFQARLDDGTLCGLHVAGSARFTTSGGKLVLASDGVTQPTFASAFFSADARTIGYLPLTDAPGSLLVKASRADGSMFGLLVNDGYQISDTAGDITLRPRPALSSESPWGDALSVWQWPLNSRLDHVVASGGGYPLGSWRTFVGYPAEIDGPLLSGGKLGGMRLAFATKAVVRLPNLQYPGRFAVLTDQFGGVIEDLFLAPSATSPPEWAWFHVAGEVGDCVVELRRWMADFEGVRPAGGLARVEAGTAFRTLVKISGWIVPDTAAPSKCFYLPATAGANPGRFTLEDCTNDLGLARGVPLVECDESSWSGHVKGVAAYLGADGPDTQPHAYVSGVGKVRAYTEGPALPTQGAFAAGHVHANTAPASAGVESWVCTTSGDYAGTPPKWAPRTLGTEA